jgi:hypothetical protein
MSPPIFTPDGNEVREIYLPDGSEASEVVAPDGTVVFEPAIPDSGVSRWTFDNDDTSGSTAIDVWGGNDGTINGATTGVSGANQTYTTNEAYSFDGANDEVNVGDVSDFQNFSSFTLTAWVSPNSSAESEEQGIITKATGGQGGVAFGLRTSKNSGYRLSINEGGFHRAEGGTTQVGTWQFVVGWYNGSEMRLYVDNTLVDSNTNPFGALQSRPEPVLIGNRDDGLFFDGDIDDPRVFDKALSSSELSNLYNTGRIDG